MPNGSLFKEHSLNSAGVKKAAGIVSAFDVLLDSLESVCPEGRELSITRRKLEEASVFAKKSMSGLRENQMVT